MKVLRKWLESADPLRTEAPLSETEARRMRRLVVAAAADSPSREGRPTGWVAAIIAIAFASVVGVVRWNSATDRDAETAAERSAAIDVPIRTPRQLQFVTAGGTRVIWVFNAQFEAPGSVR